MFRSRTVSDRSTTTAVEFCLDSGVVSRSGAAVATGDAGASDGASGGADVTVAVGFAARGLSTGC